MYYRFDITDTAHTQQIVDKVIAEQGPVSILVNNAGNHCKKPIEEMTVADYESVLNVHLVGAFALTKALVPQMKANKAGSIIFMASRTSYIGQPYVAGYSTAKADVYKRQDRCRCAAASQSRTCGTTRPCAAKTRCGTG